jgi:hypothetical protein
MTLNFVYTKIRTPSIETTNLAKNQIIQQAATAMLAQANAQPQAVMALLKNLAA